MGGGNSKKKAMQQKNAPPVTAQPQAPVDTPVFTANYQTNQQTEDYPDIICDDEIAPMGPGADAASDDVKHFFLETSMLNGQWILHVDENAIALDQDVSDQIERAYVGGNYKVDGQYQGANFSMQFADSLMILDESTYMVERQAKEFEEFHWMVEDGSQRPFIREIQELLRTSTGPTMFTLNEQAYRADPTNSSLENIARDVATVLVRKSKNE